MRLELHIKTGMKQNTEQYCGSGCDTENLVIRTDGLVRGYACRNCGEVWHEYICVESVSDTERYAA